VGISGAEGGRAIVREQVAADEEKYWLKPL
jgi:hypothetical protein